MYTEKERAKLLIQAATVVSTYPEVEGIVQVGSGVEGFLDEYSDIDLIFRPSPRSRCRYCARGWTSCSAMRCISGRSTWSRDCFVCLFKEWAGI